MRNALKAIGSFVLLLVICACCSVHDDKEVRFMAYYEPSGTNSIDVMLINKSQKPCLVAIPRPGEFAPGDDVFPVSITYCGLDGMLEGYVTGCPGSIYNMFLVPLCGSTDEKLAFWDSTYSFKMTLPFNIDAIEEVELIVFLAKDAEIYTNLTVNAIRHDKP